MARLPTINVACHVVGENDNQRYYIQIEGEPFAHLDNRRLIDALLDAAIMLDGSHNETYVTNRVQRIIQELDDGVKP